jgi:threonine aldolase
VTSLGPVVDLRSDTVSRPTAAMRRAIAEAEVGDDVYGDDPTVLRLEARIAELAGKEAALYVPSGHMGNQLAIAVQTRPGDQVVLDAESHVFVNEQGAMAALSGCLAYTTRGERGAITPDALAAAARDSTDDHVAHTALVCVENTHNRGGGKVFPQDRIVAIAERARGLKLAVHLDGASSQTDQQRSLIVAKPGISDWICIRRQNHFVQ